MNIVLLWAKSALPTTKESPSGGEEDGGKKTNSYENGAIRSPIYGTFTSLVQSCSKPDNFYYYSFDKEGTVDLRNVLQESTSEEEDSDGKVDEY